MRHYLGPIEAAPTRRHDGGSEAAPIPRKQLSASSSVLPTPKELNAETWKQSARAARSHARSASTQPPRGAERRLKRRRAKGTKVAVGCTSMAARAAPARMRRTCELRLQNQIQDCYAGSNDHENATAPSVRVYVNGKAPGTISCTKAEVECRSGTLPPAAAAVAWLLPWVPGCGLQLTGQPQGHLRVQEAHF